MSIKSENELEKFCRGCLKQANVTDMKAATCDGAPVLDMYLRVTNSEVSNLRGPLKMCSSCVSLLHQTHQFLKMLNKSSLILAVTERTLHQQLSKHKENSDNSYYSALMEDQDFKEEVEGVNLDQLNDLSTKELAERMGDETIETKFDITNAVADQSYKQDDSDLDDNNADNMLPEDMCVIIVDEVKAEEAVQPQSNGVDYWEKKRRRSNSKLLKRKIAIEKKRMKKYIEPKEICLICDEIVHVVSHMQKVHRVDWEEQKCARCQLEFDNLEDLISHCKSEEHIDLKCRKCDVKYEEEDTFLRHVVLKTCEKNIQQKKLRQKKEKEREKRAKERADRERKERKRKIKSESGSSDAEWETADDDSDDEPLVKKIRRMKKKTGSPRTKNFRCNICEDFVTFDFKSIFNHLQNDHPDEKKCIVCDEASFVFRSALLYHMRVHSNKNYCSTHFIAFDSLHAYKEHHAIKNHNRVCVECNNKEFENKALFIRHRRDEHMPNDILVCPQCPLTYTRSESLKNHILTFHERVRLMCDQCGNSYCTARALRRHKEQIHEGKKPDAESGSYCCDKCGKIFDKQYNLDNHKLNRHRVHVCRVCHAELNDRESLEQHFKDIGHEHYECPTCRVIFVNKTKYHIHVEQHNDVSLKSRNIRRKRGPGKAAKKPYDKEKAKAYHKIWREKQKLLGRLKPPPQSDQRYPCNICGKDFKTLAIMKCHRKLHNPDIPARFKCGICEKSFRIRRVFLDHMNSHTGNRPYQCRYCEKSFMKHSACYQHEAIHTGKRPHVCPVCLKGFITSSALRKHAESHIKDGATRALVADCLAVKRPKVQKFHMDPSHFKS